MFPAARSPPGDSHRRLPQKNTEEHGKTNDAGLDTKRARRASRGVDEGESENTNTTPSSTCLCFRILLHSRRRAGGPARARSATRNGVLGVPLCSSVFF